MPQGRLRNCVLRAMPRAGGGGIFAEQVPRVQLVAHCPLEKYALLFGVAICLLREFWREMVGTTF